MNSKSIEKNGVFFERKKYFAWRMLWATLNKMHRLTLLRRYILHTVANKIIHCFRLRFSFWCFSLSIYFTTDMKAFIIACMYFLFLWFFTVLVFLEIVYGRLLSTTHMDTVDGWIQWSWICSENRIVYLHRQNGSIVAEKKGPH